MTASAACKHQAPRSNSLAASRDSGAACGRLNQTCCAEGKACEGELGCSGGTCRSVLTDTVAYANYCKEQLGFTDPRKRMAYLSCFDSANSESRRVLTYTQSDPRLSLSPRGNEGPLAPLSLHANPLVEREGGDVWDLIFGSTGDNGSPRRAAQGCNVPAWLGGYCDPWYRLNVWHPDPGNEDIVAALHCRDQYPVKPTPSTAVTGASRLASYLKSEQAGISEEERLELFDIYNASSEMVVYMANTKSGKSCWFHMQDPYFGSHIPAPDDERDIEDPEVVAQIWNELPVKPPYRPENPDYRSYWLRNAHNAYRSPSYMACLGCHDNGPFLGTQMVMDMGNLPTDRASRKHLGLGFQATARPVKFVRTDPVTMPDGSKKPQLCTSCHAMGVGESCSTWFDHSVGWTQPSARAASARSDSRIFRSMPPEHGIAKTDAYYEEYGAHLDAMRCCCEHPERQGCALVDANLPTDQSGNKIVQRGTSHLSCTESKTGGWRQPCAIYNSCNHSRLVCASDNRCHFIDEIIGSH